MAQAIFCNALNIKGMRVGAIENGTPASFDTGDLLEGVENQGDSGLVEKFSQKSIAVLKMITTFAVY